MTIDDREFHNNLPLQWVREIKKEGKTKNSEVVAAFKEISSSILYLFCIATFARCRNARLLSIINILFLCYLRYELQGTGGGD